MSPIKRVAIVGAGPAGAITIDALTEEKAFDVIRVFERREKAGGIWIRDEKLQPKIPSLSDALNDQADLPVPVPEHLPALTVQERRLNDKEYRYTYTPVYPGLISNIDWRTMSYTTEKLPPNLLPDLNGVVNPDAPFRESEVVREWVESLFDRKGYRHQVEYNTTVERATKNGAEWVLTLRKELPGGRHNYWWQESFDALILANGHYSIPNFGEVAGLVEFEKNHPGSVEHSKTYRGPERYKGKTVVTVGVSVSAVDIATAIADVVKPPLYASIRAPHRVYGTVPFEHPHIAVKPSISHVSPSPNSRTVYFTDGSKVENVDHIIFGTGYNFSFPFLPSLRVVNRRVQGLYQHIFSQADPTLAVVGGVSSGFTFLVFEWQAVLVARFLAGRIKLPPIEDQKKWERDRVEKKGDGQQYYKIAPDFEEYFEGLRALAGDPAPGVPGRRLPKWDPAWLKIFEETLKKRIQAWRDNAKAIEKSSNAGRLSKPGNNNVRPRL